MLPMRWKLTSSVFIIASLAWSSPVYHLFHGYDVARQAECPPKRTPWVEASRSPPSSSPHTTTGSSVPPGSSTARPSLPPSVASPPPAPPEQRPALRHTLPGPTGHGSFGEPVPHQSAQPLFLPVQQGQVLLGLPLTMAPRTQLSFIVVRPQAPAAFSVRPSARGRRSRTPLPRRGTPSRPFQWIAPQFEAPSPATGPVAAVLSRFRRIAPRPDPLAAPVSTAASTVVGPQYNQPVARGVLASHTAGQGSFNPEAQQQSVHSTSQRASRLRSRRSTRSVPQGLPTPQPRGFPREKKPQPGNLQAREPPHPGARRSSDPEAGGTPQPATFQAFPQPTSQASPRQTPLRSVHLSPEPPARASPQPAPRTPSQSGLRSESGLASSAGRPSSGLQPRLPASEGTSSSLPAELGKLGAKRTASAAFGVQPQVRETVVKRAPSSSLSVPPFSVYSQGASPAPGRAPGESAARAVVRTDPAPPQDGHWSPDAAKSLQGFSPSSGPKEPGAWQMLPRPGHPSREPPGQPLSASSSLGFPGIGSSGPRPLPEASVPVLLPQPSARVLLPEPPGPWHSSGTETVVASSVSSPSVTMQAPSQTAPGPTAFWRPFEVPPPEGSPPLPFPAPSAPVSAPETSAQAPGTDSSPGKHGATPQDLVRPSETSAPFAVPRQSEATVRAPSARPVVRPAPRSVIRPRGASHLLVRPVPTRPVGPVLATPLVRRPPVRPAPIPPYLLEIGQRLGLVSGTAQSPSGGEGRSGTPSASPPASP